MNTDGRTGRLVLEFVLLYVMLPLGIAAVTASGWHVQIFWWLWGAAALSAWWLVRRRGWTAKRFFGLAHVTRRDWLHLVLRVAVVAVVLGVVLQVMQPDAMWGLLKKRPGFWGMVMVAYPVLSVLPQGVVYRGLFFERYAGLFGRWAGVVAMVVFSLAHLMFFNAHALVLTLAGGVIFVWQYRKTDSLMFASIEHALYGDLAFTVGWGMYLHCGTLALGGA